MTGGYDGYNTLDSTEVLRPCSGWQYSARLPRPMRGVRVSTVDNRVLLFGEWREILILLLSLPHTNLPVLQVGIGIPTVPTSWSIYREGDGWREVLGALKNKRRQHATSLVKYQDFKRPLQFHWVEEMNQCNVIALIFDF